jgi:hypothetical protein
MEMYAQRDSLQKKFVLAHKRIIDNKSSLMHSVMKSARAAAFGTHVRTHPARTFKIVVGHLVAGVSAIKEKIDSMGSPPEVKTVVEEMVDELKGLRDQAAETVATTVAEHVASGLGDGSPSPQWLTDLGWGSTPVEEDKKAWVNIREHFHSMEKWEQRVKVALATIQNGDPKSRPITCGHVDEVVRCHAKIFFHLVKAKEEFGTQLDFFEQMRTQLQTALTQLGPLEERVKRLAIEYEARENSAYEILKGVDLSHYSVVQQAPALAAAMERGVLEETAMPAEVDVVSAFVDPD